MPKSHETIALARFDAAEAAPDLGDLAEAASALVASAAPEVAERAFLERAAERAGCDVFARFALEHEALRIRAAGGLDVASMRPLDALMLSEHPCGRAIEARAPIQVDAADLILSRGGGPMRGLGVRTYVAAPLVAGDRVLGALVLASTRRDALGAADVSIASLAASVVAAALGQSAAAEELRRTQVRMRNFLDHATDAMFMHDHDGTILDVNRQACEALGYTREELIGRSPSVFDPIIKPEQIDALTERLDAGDLVSFDSQHRRKNGALFPVEIRIQRFREDGRQYAIALSRDITERKRVELSLRRTAETLRKALHMAGMGSWAFDVETGTFMVSREAQGIVGWDNHPRGTRELMAQIPRDDRRRVEAAWAATLAGAPYEIEHGLRVEGRLKWVSVRAEPERDAAGKVVRIKGITQDISARHALEEQVRQAQQMEALGRLAGGIAHDFNNILTVIEGYCDVLVSDGGGETAEHAAAIRDAGRRAAALTRQLLAFSRNQILAPSMLDLNEVVSETQALLSRLIGEHIRVTPVLAPDLWRARADAGQIQQVLVNLALNARDAMTGGGALTLATRNERLEERDVADVPAAKPGPHVVLEVRDTGRGMTPEMRARIFEPFFTTKGVGEGAGLGLSIVYGIITQSGGHLRVDSTVGHGTSCRVFLPATPGEMAPQSVRRASPAGGTETILLVEDEPGVRRIAEIALRAQGYKILAAENGEAALRVQSDHPGPIHLLLTDVVMPTMGGRELAAALRARRPGVRVLFMSGYTDDAVLGSEVGRDALLPKPFMLRDLVARVRAMLDAPADDARR